MRSVDGINDPSLEQKLMTPGVSTEDICNTDHCRLGLMKEPLGGSSVNTWRQAKSSYHITTFSSPFINRHTNDDCWVSSMCQAPFSVLLGTGGTVMNKVDKASTPKLTLQRLCSLVGHTAGQGENRYSIRPMLYNQYIYRFVLPFMMLSLLRSSLLHTRHRHFQVWKKMDSC